MSRPRSAAIQVRLTQRALQDLLAIERYSIEEWGRATAQKYLDEIATALDHIQQNPEILRLEPELAPGLYFYRVRKHFLVCDSQRATITVLTVIHTSMDIPARLAELEPRLIAEAEMLHRKMDQ